jgi:hypothetical protein
VNSNNNEKKSVFLLPLSLLLLLPNDKADSSSQDRGAGSESSRGGLT